VQEQVGKGPDYPGAGRNGREVTGTAADPAEKFIPGFCRFLTQTRLPFSIGHQSTGVFISFGSTEVGF
jgi:hypothetical protein